MKKSCNRTRFRQKIFANIFHFVTMQKEIYEQMLYSGPLQNDVPELTREEFEQYPMVLSLSGLFFESDIFYTYEQYLRHLSQTKDYAKGQENYSVTVTHQLPFRNIQIIILEGEWVMVSKNKFPAIHFCHPSSEDVSCFRKYDRTGNGRGVKPQWLYSSTVITSFNT